MTKTTTLILMAAGLAPFSLAAAQPPSAAAAQRYAELAAPANLPDMNIPQLATRFAPAALLPADIEMALVLPNVAEHLKTYCPAAALLASPVESIALGLADGSGKSLAALRAFHALMMLPGAAETAALEWKKDALDSLSDLITQAASRLGQESRSQAGGELAQVVIHPIYLIASPKAGAQEALKAVTTLYTDALTLQSREMPGAEPISAEGMKGLKISGKVLSELLAAAESQKDEKPADELLYLQAELSKRTFYLLAGMKGNNAVVVLCEYPEEIRWAATAEQSVLATDAWKATASCPAGSIAAAASFSPALCELAQHSCLPASGVLHRLSELFETMADKDRSQAGLFRTAAAGLTTLAGETDAAGPNITKAATLLLWETPGHVHLSLHSDARGFSYKPGKLRLTSMADAPRNLLYLETTAMQYCCKPNIPGLLQAAVDALEGGLATLRPEKRSEVSAYMQHLKNYLPELQETRQAFLTICQGLNNTDAFIVDQTECTLPFMNNKKSIVPRMAYYSGVADRAKLAQGWNTLMAAAGMAITKAGYNPLLLGALPIVASPVGHAVSYSIALPFLSPEIGGNVTVSNSAFAVGSSARLNEEIVCQATGDLDFAGAVFSINFVGLADIARSMADLAEAQKDAQAALTGDDESKAADIAEEIADGAETAASLFESMIGTSTVTDGVHTLHLDLKKR